MLRNHTRAFKFDPISFQNFVKLSIVSLIDDLSL